MITQLEKYQYPTDERFRKIAAKIADACMVFDGEIGPGKSNCPIGACLGGGLPSSTTVNMSGLMSFGESISFTRAFDGKPFNMEYDPPDLSYNFYRLGYAYRQRYTRLRTK